ncbi:MAG: aminoglycoside 3'-phosphotransferase [Candidatus Dormiibacterota bacterium]
MSGTLGRSIGVPGAVQTLAGGAPIRLVWENELGGLTFEVSAEPERRFIKWAPAGSGLDLQAEADRLAWAGVLTPVPMVLDSGEDQAGSWLVTRAVPGESAVSERWRSVPGKAVAAIGAGLRAFHDALPVTQCPFTWSASERLESARKRAALGLLVPETWHAEHRRLTVERALDELADVPPVDRAVVCHGDACAPNTLLSEEGDWSGHVDLGAMGSGDRWADLAIATWSTEWNYGPGWEDQLLSAYGIAKDSQRTRYYRLLWDLDP